MFIRTPRSILATAFGATLLLPAYACGSAPSSERTGASAAAAEADDSDGGASETCYALFHWLQKDAYSNTGGRSYPFWPPHTTTLIDVHCVDTSGNDTVVASAFRDNHGSDPGSVNANGNPMLVEVKVSDPAYGTREQLLSLLPVYSQCECAPATQFLSTTNFQDPQVQTVMQSGLAYTQAHLICTGPVTTSALVGMIQSGDYDDAIAAYASCSWDDPNAMANELGTLNAELSQYHVCNNDAILEAQQWTTFATTGAVVACDNTQSICQTPTWYYTP